MKRFPEVYFEISVHGDCSGLTNTLSRNDQNLAIRKLELGEASYGALPNLFTEYMGMKGLFKTE